MDHKNLQLVGPIILHGKEDLDLQALYSSPTSSRNFHVDDESSDLEKSGEEESRIPSVTTPGA
jgi:hypothetical protein